MNILRTVLQIVGLLIFENYLLFIVIFVIFKIGNNFVAAKKAKEMFPNLYSGEELEKEEKSSIFANLKSVVIYKISGLTMNATDNSSKTFAYKPLIPKISSPSTYIKTVLDTKSRTTCKP